MGDESIPPSHLTKIKMSKDTPHLPPSYTPLKKSHSVFGKEK